MEATVSAGVAAIGFTEVTSGGHSKRKSRAGVTTGVAGVTIGVHIIVNPDSCGIILESHRDAVFVFYDVVAIYFKKIIIVTRGLSSPIPSPKLDFITLSPLSVYPGADGAYK
jgi:hypothetical protein